MIGVFDWSKSDGIGGTFGVDARRRRNRSMMLISRLSPLGALQPIQLLLERFQSLTCLAELAFRSQTLVVGEIVGGIPNKNVERVCVRRRRRRLGGLTR